MRGTALCTVTIAAPHLVSVAQDLSHRSLLAQSYHRPETRRQDNVRPADGRTLGGVVTEKLVVGERQALYVLHIMCLGWAGKAGGPGDRYIGSRCMVIGGLGRYWA